MPPALRIRGNGGCTGNSRSVHVYDGTLLPGRKELRPALPLHFHDDWLPLSLKVETMSIAMISVPKWNPTWFLWISCLLVLLLLGRRRLRRTPKLCDLLKSENGAAYSLNLVLLTPLYTLMICFLIETTLMLNVQIGVDYAAYSAARSAIVWLPSEVTSLNTEQQLVDMVHLAATQALTPYASSLDSNRRADGAQDPTGDEGYLRAYKNAVTTGTTQVDDYVLKKRQYAMAATHVEFDPPLDVLLSGSHTANQSIRVTVKYEMPFNIPGVGIILGRRSAHGPGFVRELTASVELEMERAKTENGRLGIEYDSRPAGGGR